jgi:hypothetical protein
MVTYIQYKKRQQQDNHGGIQHMLQIENPHHAAMEQLGDAHCWPSEFVNLEKGCMKSTPASQPLCPS